MKKCKVLPIIALASFLIFSLYACGSNNTGFELQPNPQRNHYTDTVLTQQEFPRIGAVQYTYSFAELMFTAQFAAPEGKDITTHPLYPKKYESENALIDALKNGKIDIALIQRVSSATDFPDGITARKLSSDALVFRTSQTNPVSMLTAEQLKSILGGSISDWSQVGGEKGEIVLLADKITYPNANIITQMTMIKDFKAKSDISDKAKAAIELRKNQSVAASYSVNSDFVLEPTPYMSYIWHFSLVGEDGTKIITPDGIQISPESVLSGEYPYSVCTYMLSLKQTDMADKFFDVAENSFISLISDIGADEKDASVFDMYLSEEK